jgi:F0F1-type ATP synthase assembly protein I
MADNDRTSGLRLAGVGIEFAAAVAGLSLLGLWIDRHYGSAPWGVLIGAGVGLIGGTYNLIRAATARPSGQKTDGEKPHGEEGGGR